MHTAGGWLGHSEAVPQSSGAMLIPARRDREADREFRVPSRRAGKAVQKDHGTSTACPRGKQWHTFMQTFSTNRGSFSHLSPAVCCFSKVGSRQKAAGSKALLHRPPMTPGIGCFWSS